MTTASKQGLGKITKYVHVNFESWTLIVNVATNVRELKK